MSLTSRDDLTAAIPGALTRVGLDLPPDLPYDRWLSIVETLRTINGSALWWWGDAINYGEDRYGEKYSQALEDSDYTYGTLANASYVCKRIEISRRRENLSFGHHQAVAALEPAVQERWLEEADRGRWSRTMLREAIKGDSALFDEPATPMSPAAPPASCGPTMAEWGGSDEPAPAREWPRPPAPAGEPAPEVLTLSPAFTEATVAEACYAFQEGVVRLIRQARDLVNNWGPEEVARFFEPGSSTVEEQIDKTLAWYARVRELARQPQGIRRVK